ncbi:MAG: hypothetical protein ACKVX7_16195 [Planctomycetota bacterium]
MRKWLGHLDGLLRGEKTRKEQLETGEWDLPLPRCCGMAIILGVVYGVFMGIFAATDGRGEGWRQLIASAVKIPALFLLTLLVTFPSLYVFAALAGCQMGFRAVLRLLVAVIVVTLAIAASLAPILGFFTLSTTSYNFMVLLNVVLLAVAGFVGLGFLRNALRKLMAMSYQPPAQAPRAEGAERAPLEERLERRMAATHSVRSQDAAHHIFRLWILIYCLVGAQMGWLLRPFIGSPGLPFTWFRARTSNFFAAIFDHLEKLFGQ